ncbi:GNAT family N-acetyltransferase [Solibacillus sp. CAU 1738]|uniref:GNAT family N-acetyltransferase n=1 Tax=Solibacillus sp. CAU 1738 TaxID=3140363 RepID=UPI00325FEDBB
MNFSAITVSFPIDEETFGELKALCQEAAQADAANYELVMNLHAARNYEMSGFYVLVYDDEQNKLVGMASAVDMMGLKTFEWSVLVSPMYRQLGIGNALVNVLQEGMAVRGAEGELALTVENSPFGANYLMKKGYHYSFSEATLEAKAEMMTPYDGLTIRRFEFKDTLALVEIFSAAFGDTLEEAHELIEFNSTTADLILWVAEVDNVVVGTVTTRKEGEVQWVTALAVHPEFEGRGIGSALLNWAKDFAYRGGEKTVLLDVEIENLRALSVYEKAGFIKSMQIDYYVYGG